MIISELECTELYLIYYGEKQYLQKDENNFSITLNALLTFFTEPNKVIYFYNENGEFINLKEQSIEFEERSFLKKDGHYYYIFPDLKNNLSLIYNKKPALNYIYGKDATFKGAHVENEIVYLNFEFSTKFFKPTKITSSVCIRKTQETFNFNVENYAIEAIGTNKYKINASIKLSLEDIKSLIGENVDIFNYDFSVYDVFFNFKISEMPISNMKAKIKFNKMDQQKYDDENWIEYDKYNQLLLRVYRTFHGYLSFKVTALAKSTYNYYEEHIKKNKHIFSSDKPTIVCVEYPSSAQDNGLAFFEYLMKHHSRKYNIYYLIHKNSPDLKNLSNYMDRVVFYKTSNHIKILYEADVICHTHTSYYMLPFRVNELEKELASKKRVFLQHGIMGVRNLKGMYARKPHERFTDLFVVSSEREKRMITSGYGYDEKEVILSGLSRFDNLIKEKRNNKFKLKNERKILIMPTWRPVLDGMSDEAFMNTEYYKTFQSLINNDELHNLAEKNNKKILLFLHRNFQKFNHLFKSDFVSILSNDDYDIKDLLYDSTTLVTDYSSVALDFAIMKRKVVYYQPKEIMEKKLNTFDKGNLPGNVVLDETELIKELATDEIKKDLDLSGLYKYKDKKASKRIFKHMKKSFDL
ncbi:CDP-glycerol glycerophosphotransferase family protein [Staphylococcus gallinarum]|uniref:CDP-glycerol glycerophosphotransferase family protein n=1 Tax=Staphylococcus gallinarum TaxID=1293 RepID=UPI00115C45BB|nr:CDP-glycerol glycerophosphotransferase family protein [Staphylococcus gallinarum]